MTAGDHDTLLLGRIVRPADYVRVLATTLRLRSPHFAIHYVEGRPLPLKKPMPRVGASASANGAPAADVGVSVAIHAPVVASLSTELSTGHGPALVPGVEDLVREAGFDPDSAPGEAPELEAVVRPGPQRWLGLVVPKRHAKRAVTRTLVKRQIRHIAADCAAQLAPGLWVVRQRMPFDPKQYPSAASDALKDAARAELRALFERAVRGEQDRVKPRPPRDASAPVGKLGNPGKAAKGVTAGKTGSAASHAAQPAKPAKGPGKPLVPPATPEGNACAA